MKTALEKFKNVETKLKAKSWFTKDGWIVSVHEFPKQKPRYITFHVTKKNWFNEDKQGIHIESFLPMDPKEKKKSYVTIHVLHDPKIPGTKLSRKLIAQPFVDAIYDDVRHWDGYKFRAGKYGTQPFTKEINSLDPDFENILEAEVSKMCQLFGPIIDQILIEVLKGTDEADYFFENGLMVFTKAYHLKRGYCCESGCRFCPY